MQHQSWSGAATIFTEQDLVCVRAQSLNTTLREAPCLGRWVIRTAGWIASKAWWAFTDFWNIPVLGPSEPRR